MMSFMSHRPSGSFHGPLSHALYNRGTGLQTSFDLVTYITNTSRCFPSISSFRASLQGEADPLSSFTQDGGRRLVWLNAQRIKHLIHTLTQIGRKLKVVRI